MLALLLTMITYATTFFKTVYFEAKLTMMLVLTTIFTSMIDIWLIFYREDEIDQRNGKRVIVDKNIKLDVTLYIVMVTRQRILTKAILVMAFKKEKWHKREEGESKLVKTQFFLFGFTAWCFYAFPVTDKLLFCFELHLKCLICQAFKNDHKSDNFLLLLESFFTEMKWQTCGESNCGVIFFSWIHTFCALPWTSTA